MARFPGLPAVVPALLLSLVACSTSEEPPTGDMTLLVTNTSCTISQCTPQEVYGFPSNGPHFPGGPWAVKIGVVSGPSACLQIPASAITYGIEVHNDGTADSTAFEWTSAIPFSVGTKPAAPFSWAVPSTEDFVPADGRGWKVALPEGGRVSKAEACSP
jgi:hypothetical protein